MRRRAWHHRRVVVAIVVGAVLVLMLIALRLGDRRERRKGHTPARMGDVRYALREQHRDVRAARRTAFLGGLPGKGPNDPRDR